MRITTVSTLEKKEKMASVPTKSFRYTFWWLKSQTFLSEKIIINKTETETLAGLPLKAHIRAHILLLSSQTIQWKLKPDLWKTKGRVPITYLQNTVMAGANIVVDEQKKWKKFMSFRLVNCNYHHKWWTFMMIIAEMLFCSFFFDWVNGKSDWLEVNIKYGEHGVEMVNLSFNQEILKE